ncbi:MAG: heparinase II/III family protein [Clostridia bacterium]|nr:heparinase II/III family protein [Clostridia bacterium]
MNLLGKASKPEFWASIKDKPEYKFLLDAVLKDYEECCHGEIETTKFSAFRLFKDKGDRTAYQKVFFKRQHRLYAMAFMTLLYPENESYLELLQDTIWEICDQYVWALPAHIDNIEVNNVGELDLDATTMSMALAMIKIMLENRLHPLIKSRIDYEIDRRLVEPFFKQNWHWEYRKNNWTAVCAGATGCTLMLNRPELFEKAQARLNEDMASYISSYKNDGVCVEGAGYWSYGFGYFVEYARMQREFTNGKVDLLKDEKIKSISTFLQKLFLDRDVIVNYGDCGAGTDVCVPHGFMYSLKNLYPDVLELPPMERLSMQVHYFPFAISAFVFFDKDYTYGKLSKEAEYYMGDCGWFTKRTSKYGFSARGGCNGESHNHNDVGTFILAVDNDQLIIDMGGRPYTRQYFEHATRYTYLETSSRGHNVPIINGKYQANIPEAYPTTSFENGVFSVDFRVAYDAPEVTKLVRQYAPYESKIVVTDSFEGVSTLVERLVSYKEPVIEEGKITIGKAVITFDPALACASYEKDVHARELTPEGDIKVGEDVYLSSIEVKNPKESFTFTIEVL